MRVSCRIVPFPVTQDWREEKRREPFRPVENPRAKSVISASCLVESEGTMDCSRHWTALLLCVAYMQRTQTRKETPRDSQRLPETLTGSVCNAALCSESGDAVVSVRRNSDAVILRGTNERMAAPRQSSIVFCAIGRLGWIQMDRPIRQGRPRRAM